MEFVTIEIRKAKNGFIITITTEEDSEDYVADTSRKAIKMVKDYVDAKTTQTED